MANLLNAFRWLISSILLLILLFSLIAGVYIKALVDISLDEDNIKRYLSEGRVYEEVVNQSYEYAQHRLKQTGETKTLQLFQTEGIHDRIKSVVSENWIQTQTETFIDGIYTWLKGGSNKPYFSIDLSSIKEPVSSLSSNLSEIALVPTSTIDRFFETQSDLTFNEQDIEWNTNLLKNGPIIYSWIEHFSFLFFPLVLVFTTLLFFIIPGKTPRLLGAGGVFLISSLLQLTGSNQFSSTVENIIGGNIELAMNPSAIEILMILKIFKKASILFERDFFGIIQFQSLMMLIAGLLLFGWGIFELNKNNT